MTKFVLGPTTPAEPAAGPDAGPIGADLEGTDFMDFSTPTGTTLRTLRWSPPSRTSIFTTSPRRWIVTMTGSRHGRLRRLRADRARRCR